MKNREEILEAIAVLIRVAQDDRAVHAQLRTILSLPTFQRASVINSAVAEMVARGESSDVRTAFGLLATPEGAEAALQLLEERDAKS